MFRAGCRGGSVKKVEVDIFGQRLVLQGDGDEAYVQQLARYVDEHMRTLAEGMKTATPSRLAILAAINIADQLFQQEKRRQAGEIEVERRATSMLACIEGQLSQTLSN